MRLAFDDYQKQSHFIIEKLKKDRDESLDQHELDKNHLKLAEKAYFELADIYNFKTIECCINDEIRTIDDINDELFNYVIDYIKSRTVNKTVLLVTHDKSEALMFDASVFSL